jgi:hypothetical protein
MTTENILYTDGHQVTVTDSTFQVRKNHYRLEGITNHGFHIIKPNRLPAYILSGIGLLAIGLGISNVTLPIAYTLNVYSYKIPFNVLLISAGIALIVISLLISILLKERYGVRNATAEGEKNVIVSERKEYVNMIVEALDYADQSSRQNKLEY